MDSQSTDQAGIFPGLLDAPEGCTRKTEEPENFPDPKGETRMTAGCSHPPEYFPEGGKRMKSGTQNPVENFPQGKENFPDPPQGQTRDLVAKATGFGNGKTYEQAKTVIEKLLHTGVCPRGHGHYKGFVVGSGLGFCLAGGALFHYRFWLLRPELGIWPEQHLHDARFRLVVKRGKRSRGGIKTSGHALGSFFSHPVLGDRSHSCFGIKGALIAHFQLGLFNVPSLLGPVRCFLEASQSSFADLGATLYSVHCLFKQDAHVRQVVFCGQQSEFGLSNRGFEFGQEKREVGHLHKSEGVFETPNDLSIQRLAGSFGFRTEPIVEFFRNAQRNAGVAVFIVHSGNFPPKQCQRLLTPKLCQRQNYNRHDNSVTKGSK